MTATLILLTVLGVVTVFWEPLAALAGGGPEAESVGEARTSSPDGGPGATPSPSVTGGAATPSAVPARIPAGIFDGSTSS